MTSARTPCSFTSRGTATCHFALAARLAVAAIAMLFPTGARAAQPAGPAPLLVDVDSDGIADSLAVEIGYDAASPRTGRVFVVSGATGQTLYVIEGSEPNDRFGHSVRIATVQEAGPVELLVAAPGAAGGLGRIDFFSAASGVQMRSISAPQGARIGMAFDVIADQDGDGWRELIVEGAVEGNPWQARTFVFSGRTGALLATRAATLGGLRRHVEAGGRVYVAADFNDNGVVDAHDISRIVSGLASGGGGQDEAFDVNRDGVVNAGDVAAAVEALLRGDRSIVATGLVTEVQGEAAAMQARWSEVHGGDELSLTWSFVTHAAGGEGEEPGGMQTASSTGSQEGGTLPGRRPCSCGSVGSNIPSEDPGCSANIEGCPLQSVPVGSVIVLHPPGPGCTFTFNGGTAVPADPNHPWVLTAMAPGCTTVRMECNDGACCACQECVICVYAADEQPPCEVAVGFEVCPDCTDLIDPELGPQLFPIDRLGSLVVTAVGVPEGGVYEWSLRLVDGCAPCPDFCEPSFDYPTPTGTLRISEHPRFAQLSPVDGQVLWIHVRYRLDECDPDCCHAIALCRVALYERDCTVDTDQDSFCDCDEDAYSTDPSDPASRPAARLIDLDLDGISRLDDVRGPTEYSRFWPWSPRPYVERFDTDNDGVQDLAELDLGLDPERTHSVSGVYDRRSPLNLLADRDQDLVYDVYELRLGLDPTVRDTDEDGIVDGIEMRAGTDPLVSHRHESPDTDGDGLSDYEEVVIYRTRPNWYDTDNDGLDDFFEVRAGLNPRSAYSQERTVWLVPTGGGPPVPIQAPGPHDTMGDTDDDGLSNFLEQIYGTDPTLWDSDGDGVSDGEEVDQGSNPTDPSDGGRPPNPEEVCRFTLTIGDHSGSHSERWQLNVGDIRWRAPNYGQVVSRTFTFRRGASYPITVQHIGTILPSPDYDYTALVQPAGDCPCWSIDDSQTLLGVHDESYPNYAAGKIAWLRLPAILPDPETHVTADALTILPGDTEQVRISCGNAGTEVRARIADPTIAQFLVDETLQQEIVLSTTLDSYTVVGLAEGTTSISMEDPCECSLPVIVGGSVIVEYNRAPTFKLVPYNGSLPESQGPETEDYELRGPNPVIEMGGGPVLRPIETPNGPQLTFVGGRLPVPSDVVAMANALPAFTAVCRVTVLDGAGNRKPGKAVALVGRDGKISAQPGTTNRDGETDIDVAANSQTIQAALDAIWPPELHPAYKQEYGLDKERIAVLIGRSAQNASTVEPTLVDDIWLIGPPQSHTFTGRTLRFNRDGLAPPSEMGGFTATAIEMPLLNHVHSIVLENQLQVTHYRRSIGLDGSPYADPWHNADVWLDLPDPITGLFKPTLVTHPGFLFDADSSGNALHHALLMDAINTSQVLWSSNLAQLYPNLAFAVDIQPLQPGERVPGGGVRAIDVAAVIAEFGLGFAPGYDFIDVVKEGFWKPVINGEPTGWGYTIAGVALVGLLADAGYLAGPAGLVTNAVTGVLKAIVKHTPPEVTKALLRIGANATESIGIVRRYISKFPKPENFDPFSVSQVKAWGEATVGGIVRTWDQVLRSPLQLGPDHLARAIRVIDARCTRTLSADATEGIAAYVKLGRDGETAIDGALVKLGSGLSEELADTVREGVSNAFQKTYRYENELQAAAIARVDDAVAACQATLHPSYRGVIGSFIGETHVIRSMEEFEALRFIRGENLAPEQKAAINTIRSALGGISQGQRVAKVIPLNGQFGAISMVANGNPNLAGAFARASDLDGAVTTTQLIDRLRLDSPPYFNFIPGSPHAIIETNANAAIAASARVPVSSGYGNVAGGPPREIIDDWGYPFTGNGLTASRDGRIVPEFVTAGRGPVPMSAGLDESGQPVTTLKFRFDDGTPYPQTINGQTASDWKLITDPNNPELFQWVPL